MPVIKSADAKDVGKNIKTEMDAGKPHKQAVAIALSVQDEAKKKAKTAQEDAKTEYVDAWKEGENK
ncbi:hypothetical protein [Polynucleobacter sp. UK-Kesae-W10]|uniref:hypothetical protein n=1 Tax=Polynucleobacter sp. UK-Kesae-W10 TaxID=1819738 RepID=UPI001C0B94CC|nr:hypothetical protein [Polynucleobacter sp. UK-Kesae-W10]MBU3577575.1 hypothetical protein [Polynucleobacter sp. UK-Kesae-W10]